MTPQALLAKYPIISKQVDKKELAVILREFNKTLKDDVPGDVTEFGCHIGTTSLFLQRLLDAHDSEKELHVYDSFEGLPAKSAKDQSPAGMQFQPGELKVSKRDMLQHFYKADLDPPITHKAWFDELTDRDIPQTISFAYLDGDFYESILTPLHLIWSRLSPGAIVVIDDYGREALPGVTKAVDEFCALKHIPSIRHDQSIAILHVPQA